MVNVLIVGAGSIGNHLAYACRNEGWAVEIFDLDPAALVRCEKEIYPSRYGAWDDQITLSDSMPANRHYEVCFIGTPPDAHLPALRSFLSTNTADIVTIEKPLCEPIKESIDDIEEIIATSAVGRFLVGYNHNLSAITNKADELCDSGFIGEPKSIHVRWLEHWGGIFSAHPWLAGPQDSYLGNTMRGGGAIGEHSHGIALWLHFASRLAGNSEKNVKAFFRNKTDDNVDYDESVVLCLESRSGIFGTVIQDVVTQPAEKFCRIQGSEGFIQWQANVGGSSDVLVYGRNGSDPETFEVHKTRPDDFKVEIEHIAELLNGLKDSNIDISIGLECMNIIRNSIAKTR